MIDNSISLDRLTKGFHGISPTVGAAHAEACLICLDHHEHSSPLELSVEGTNTTHLQLQWHDTISEQSRRSWHDLTIATEWAACGISFLLVEHFLGYTVFRQARKGNGVDYWLGAYGEQTQLVKKKARLEVSGILNAKNQSTITARVKQKKNQVSEDNIETYVVVVEFSQPAGWMERVK